MTQAELARRAGVSRQLVGAAEAGRNLPRVDAGVALARVLGVPVEEIFGRESSPADVLTGALSSEGELLRVGRVGSQIVTAALHRGNEGWGTADGVIEGGALVSFGERRDGLVVAGCEPGLEVLERSLRQSGAAALSVMASSSSAIKALQSRRVHAAVVHGPALQHASELPDIVRFRLASWRVGLADAADAPTGWFEDALSGRRPVVQREHGAGVQQAFEAAVVSGGDVPGPRVSGHLEAASRAVYGGIPAVTIEPAALAAGADFRSLDHHETQLWVAAEWADDRIVAEALDVMESRSYRLRLQAVGGYDLSGYMTRVT